VPVWAVTGSGDVEELADDLVGSFLRKRSARTAGPSAVDVLGDVFDHRLDTLILRSTSATVVGSIAPDSNVWL